MKNGSLESLLDSARGEEKKYEWLQAAELYKKASSLALKNNNLSKAATLTKRNGFCFCRATFQAQTNMEFKERLNLAIQAFDREIKVLQKVKEKNKQTRIRQAKARIIYARSWLETNVLRKKELLDEWWTLENKVLKEYESIGDLRSIGVVCTDMLEFSLHDRLLLSDHSDNAKMEKEAAELAEKAIRALSKSGDTYELARAYCFASIWYCSQTVAAPEFRDKRFQFVKKGHSYSKKALELSAKTGDAWLIGWANSAAYTAIIFYDFNHSLATDYGKETQKYGSIAKDKLLLSYGISHVAYSLQDPADFYEDPDKQRASYEKARKLSQECRYLSQIINHTPSVCLGYIREISALNRLSTIETDPKLKQEMLKKAINSAREGLKVTGEWKKLSFMLYTCLSDSLRLLSGTKSDAEEKKTLLFEAESYQKEHIARLEDFNPFNHVWQSLAYYNLGLVQIELAKVETDKTGKAEALRKAVSTLKKSSELLERVVQVHPETKFMIQVIGKHADRLGRVQQQYYYLTNNKESLPGSIESHTKAAAAFARGEMPAHAAESYWYIAQLQSEIGKHQEAAQNYESASQAYDLSTRKIPQLKDFYSDYSLFMQAWSQIEQAKYAHSIENYDKAKHDYEEAAKLHESTEPWSYLSPNYFAWANMEDAEGLSRKENVQEAKEAFQKALEYFNQAENSIKQKIEEITSEEEQQLNLGLFEASDLRRRFCQARIQIEEAKLLDRGGKYLQSSESYEEAAQNILSIVEKVESEAERKELEYLATLCQAWEKMAVAEETTSSESYMEAAGLFEKAKEYCYTKKASLWTLGNSNFCKGLAAGARYQGSMNLKENAIAKSLLKNAAACYLQAGFKNASEYAKATQRLFDAYVFMNQAENEVNPENRAKQCQMAENLLQISAESFAKAKQSEKAVQVQQIIRSVKEEKALAVCLNEVMHAPTITSSTTSFTAPSPTNETSAGLKSFEHANVQANLIAGMKEVKVGESFCLSVEFVNAGKEPALLTRIEDFVPHDFIVVKKPEIYRLEDTCLNMKGKQIAPLKLVEAKLILQPSKKGIYQLKPTIHYLDELGQNKSLQLKSVEIKVEEVILADRVSTGTKELDSLLLGGIPKEYAVVLTGPPSDERELIVKNFLKAGSEQGQTSFYITTEAVGIENLLDKSGFYLFLSNPKPKVEVPDLPNVTKLRSKTDINNLNMALARESRNLQKQQGTKRLCIEIVSDVLVEYGVKTTRKWISELLTDLCPKGFNILAVLDSGMHTSEEANAITYLFDGEISITQSDDPQECKKSLTIKKLRNQDYIKNPICLTK